MNNQEPDNDDILAITIQLILVRIIMISNLVASISLIIVNEGIKRYYFIAALIFALFLVIYFLKSIKIKMSLIYSIILALIIFAANYFL
ncbi:hypothetical protein [Brachyspira hampsonii]|uniref:Uncharacterized protein n=1 Tax=Brachyspira hampsonii 30446 TaxID=1289135 RepID=A0A2U4F0L5_9SPIR|nr:hypothetical protein [Brachyspira hampsonii]EKV57732.1 hypothetical protein A966_04055 [Brachyspira hampsonii 30446]MBW5390050.1 hypothetical protein [Brachyspira hampsonii]MBW5394984.1 hypothetical protein [Brachyspira hampsonii]OEJ20440.1 hypothetical protein A9495_12005 [Brachyspira hampsonii]